MDTQIKTDMTQEEIQKEKSEELVLDAAEREFLKDLYIFMKKRDTPIERIPNLGFKQIDLYVMFQTVQEMGGYHQVTAQQMWKQVYNTLGGNPRSTSAATCTRRHYEKLLLPYECQKKGIPVSLLPQHQPKPFPFASFSKEDDDGQRPAKRRLVSMPLQQSSIESDPCGRIFPLPIRYPPYYPQTHAVQAARVPISSHVLTPVNPPATQPWFSFLPSHPDPTERVEEPLKHLRYLAEQYKTSSGLAEPLNLSVKASQQETNRNPVSSFAPPSSSKSPKFLNKPSTLYAPQSPQVRSEGGEAQEGEAGSEDQLYSHPSRDRETYVVDVKAIRTSSSPRYLQTSISGEDSPTPAAQLKEEGQQYPDLKSLNLSQILPTLARENGGKMEIEIPLPVFYAWLKMCGSTHGLKQLVTRSPLDEQRSCSSADVLPTDRSFHMSPQQQSPVAEDLRPRKRHLPSPTAPSIQTPSPPLNMSQNPISSYKPLPSRSILKNPASQDVYPEYKPYTSRSPSFWDTYSRDGQVKIESRTPPTVQQDPADSKSYDDDVVLVETEKSATTPSTLLRLGSGSAPLLQFTTEEVMKLKEIISRL